MAQSQSSVTGYVVTPLSKTEGGGRKDFDRGNLRLLKTVVQEVRDIHGAFFHC